MAQQQQEDQFDQDPEGEAINEVPQEQEMEGSQNHYA